MNMDTIDSEKRRSKRVPHEARAFFHGEGEDPIMLRLCDQSRHGIGAYSRKPVEVGAKATLSVRLKDDDAPHNRDAQVRWCVPCNEKVMNFYKFRVGLEFEAKKDSREDRRRSVREMLERKLAEKKRAQAEEQASKQKKKLVGERAKSHPAAPAKTAEPAKRPAFDMGADTSPVPVPSPVSQIRNPYRVKGHMLVDFAKVVRKNPGQEWDSWLSEEDKDIVMGNIVPVAWYPIDTFRRIGMAVHSIMGRGQDEAARGWGRESVQRIPANLFESFIDKKDPVRAIRNWTSINAKTFDCFRYVYKSSTDKSCTISVCGDPVIRKNFPELYLVGLIICGALTEIARVNGAKAPKAMFDREGSGEDLMIIKIEWQ